jgi:hypothetical protein
VIASVDGLAGDERRGVAGVQGRADADLTEALFQCGIQRFHAMD